MSAGRRASALDVSLRSCQARFVSACASCTNKGLLLLPVTDATAVTPPAPLPPHPTRQVCCQSMAWLDNIVVVCSGPDPAGRRGSGSDGGAADHAADVAPELLLFPRFHLDMASLLCRHPLSQLPIAMDCVGNHILLASEPLEIALFEVEIQVGRRALVALYRGGDRGASCVCVWGG